MEKYLRYIKGLKEELSSSYSVFDGVVWRFSEKYRMFFWIALEVFEYVSPDGFHLIPILDYTVLYRITQFDQSFIFFLYASLVLSIDLQLLNQ